MTYPVCPCDGEQIAPPVNLPELSYISYRVGTYVTFRQGVLTPLFTPATSLPPHRTAATPPPPSPTSCAPTPSMPNPPPC